MMSQNVCKTIFDCYYLFFVFLVIQHVIVRAVEAEYHGISGINSIYNISVTGDKYSFNAMYVSNVYNSELNLAVTGTMVMHLNYYPLFLFLII